MSAGRKVGGRWKETQLNAFAFTVFFLAQVQVQGKIQGQMKHMISVKKIIAMKRSGAEMVCRNSCGTAYNLGGKGAGNS